MTIFSSDTFTRANQSGFGTASGGGTWTSLVGAPTLSIASNEGNATGIAGDFALYLGPSETLSDGLVRFSNSDAPNNANGIYLRIVDANNFYRCFAYNATLAIDKKVAGTFTGSIGTAPITIASNTYYWLRFRAQGNNLLARTWADGLAEPSSWSITITDTSLTSGFIGIGAFQNATADVATFDHFVASDGMTTPTGVTPITLYGSSVASTTLGTADQFATATGGTETSTVTTSPASGSGYLEILSQGGTGTLNASIPAPSGRGWLFDSTALEGNTLIAGIWSGSIVALSDAVGATVASIIVRAYKRSAAGVYAPIGTLTLAGPTLATTRTTYSLPAASFGAMSFASGDKLYVDLLINATWATDTIHVFESTSASAGVAGDLQIVTPGYSASPVPIPGGVFLSNYASAILADTPQAYYRLDETSGNTAYDASGNGYNATLYGSYSQSQTGAIVSDTDTSTFFTGAAGLQLPYTLNPTAWHALSLEFWTNANGSWQHIVATCTGSTTIVYINAVVVTPSTPALIDISSIFDWAGSYHACNLDEIAVYSYVLSSGQVSNHYTTGTSPVASPGTPGGVRLLINDVWYPTIRQETISINRTANDPIPTFSFILQDDPSQIPLSELQEVIFIDAGQVTNPTHNLLRNPMVVPYTTSWTTQTAAGGTITQLNPGVRLTMSNATGNMQLSQQTQPSMVMPGQSYCLSLSVSTSATLTNCFPYFSLYFFDANLNTLNSQTILIPANTPTARVSIQLQASNAAVYLWAAVGISQSSGTNSGSLTFWNVQLEPMSFASGKIQQSYPTPFCANGQTSCTLMPDGTAIRQYRLFGGYITKAVAGRYIGNNRQWSVTVSGYAWLIQKQQLNDNFTTKTDSFIINNLITKYFPNQFSTAQVATGATLDVFGYAWNGTLRDAFDALATNSNFYYYIDAYRTIFYQPPGYNQLGFQLSDHPDNVQSFPYYNYTYDIDGTQLGNATLVTGASGISAIEYDAQSIGHYNLKTNGQGVFWRTVNDSSITSTNAARMRAIAENTQYNYARQIAHLSTQQMMIPGYSVIFSSATDQVFEQSFLIQKSTLILQGFVSQGIPQYECQVDIGAWNPDLVNITVRMLRKQQVSTNSIGTPVIGLMATEELTFIDQVNITVVHANPATYSMGIYGTSTYAASVPGIPPTTYGSGFYGDPLHGYL